jgi:hypothetical protein
MSRKTRAGFMQRMVPDKETAAQLYALGSAIREACEDAPIPLEDIALLLSVLALDVARSAVENKEEPDDQRPH